MEAERNPLASYVRNRRVIKYLPILFSELDGEAE
jgi:hypothetical protein